MHSARIPDREYAKYADGTAPTLEPCAGTHAHGVRETRRPLAPADAWDPYAVNATGGVPRREFLRARHANSR